MRVGAAMRLFQAHGQTPALAGMHCRDFGQHLFVGEGAVPVQLNTLRNSCFWGEYGFSCELKTHAARPHLRERGNRANHFDITPFPFVRQVIRQAHVCAQRGVAKTKQQRRQRIAEEALPVRLFRQCPIQHQGGDTTRKQRR